MRKLFTFTFAFVIVAPLNSEAEPNGSKTPIADALEWYSVWQSESSSRPDAQTCRGELQNHRYRFRCDPLSVVVDANFDDSGHCYIVFMKPALGEQDDLHVPKLPPRAEMHRQQCGELPIADGPFEITVILRSRIVDDDLTARARNAALSYQKQGGETQCALHFPKVKAGDPFFHVYEECEGAIDAIWEFTIRDRKIADFPHWTYTRERRDLPNGIAWRLSQRELWFDVSMPEQRRARRKR